MPKIHLYVRDRTDSRVIAEKFVNLPPGWEAMSLTEESLYLRNRADEFLCKHIAFGALVEKLMKEIG